MCVQEIRKTLILIFNLCFVFWLLAVTSFASAEVALQAASNDQVQFSISSGSDFVLAIAQEDVVEAVLARSVVLREDDWAGMPVPIPLSRNITITGALQPNGDLPVIDFAYLQYKVLLYPRVAFTLQDLAIMRYRNTLPSQAPGFDLIQAPDPGGPPGIGILRRVALMNLACFPAETSQLNTNLSSRPPEYPGVQNVTFYVPQPGCINDTAAPLLQRCWATRRHYNSLILYAAEIVEATQRYSPVNYHVLCLDTPLLCPVVLARECVAELGPLGCYLQYVAHRQPPPPPMPTSRPAPSPLPLPAGPLLLAGGSGGGGGIRGGRLAGIVVGSVAGLALLCEAAAGLALACRRRHRLFSSDLHNDNGGSAKGTDASADPPEKLAAGGLEGDDASLSAHTATAAAAAGACVGVECGPAAGADTRGCGGARAQAGGPWAAADEADASGCVSGQFSGQRISGVTNASAADAHAASCSAPITPLTPQRPDLRLDVSYGGSGHSEGGGGSQVTLLPDRVLGRGSYGRVVEGEWRGQRVAVKLVADAHAWAGPAEALVKSFAQEVEVLGRCDHHCVVRLLAACLQPPSLCLVMERMEGSLEGLLYGGGAGTGGRREPDQSRQLISMHKVLHIGIEIARGLEYLHPTITHRDLKPANVLLNGAAGPAPLVRISDFGLSRLRSTVRLTSTAFAGTPAYLAPEGFEAVQSVITHQADVYSLGVILWEMLSGERPWRGHDAMAIAYGIKVAGRRLPLDRLPPSRCPPKLRRLLAGCWDCDPRRRPAAAELVKELALVAQELSAHNSPDPAATAALARAQAHDPPTSAPAAAAAAGPPPRAMAGTAAGSTQGSDWLVGATDFAMRALHSPAAARGAIAAGAAVGGGRGGAGGGFPGAATAAVATPVGGTLMFLTPPPGLGIGGGGCAAGDAEGGGG